MTPEMGLGFQGRPAGAPAKRQRRTSSVVSNALEPQGFQVNDDETKPDRHPRSCAGVLHYPPAAHFTNRGLKMMRRVAPQAAGSALWSTPWGDVLGAETRSSRTFALFRLLNAIPGKELSQKWR